VGSRRPTGRSRYRRLAPGGDARHRTAFAAARGLPRGRLMRALRPGERTALVVAACFIIAAAIAVGFPYVASPSTQPSPGPIGPQATPFIFPGKVRPPTVLAAAANLPDDEPVIGVMAKKTARAYVRKAFAGMPNHVVNDVVGDTPVTVTHFNGCTRVYTGPGTEPLRFMTGGLADGLLLCVD